MDAAKRTIGAGRRAVLLLMTCVLPLGLAGTAAATSMEGTPHVRAVAGSGTAVATGEWGAGKWPYDATLTTTFTPDHINPGQGFTFTAYNVERLNEWADDPGSCHPGSSPNLEDPNTKWLFYKVDPGAILWDDAAPDALYIDGNKTEHIHNMTACPFDTTTRDLSYTATAGDTAGLAPGCYQSITTNAGYDYPFPGSDAYSSTVVKSLEGAVATLKVGSGPPCQADFILSLAVKGESHGTIHTAEVSCHESCGHGYPSGQQVAVTATPDGGYEFDHWEGACSLSGACSVTMDSNKSVTAVFRPISYTLSLSVKGPDQGEISTTEVKCSVSCSHDYPYGQAVSVTASPFTFNGWEFDHWEGACGLSGACSVTMDGDKTVIAVMRPKMVTITVVKHSVNGGQGRVTGPAGLNCGPVCGVQVPFDQIAFVSLKVAVDPLPGSFVLKLDGGCTDNGLLPTAYATTCEAGFHLDDVVADVYFRGYDVAIDTNVKQLIQDINHALVYGATPAGVVCLASVVGTVPCTIIGGVLLVEQVGTQVYLDLAADDPPDPNYKVIASAKAARVPKLFDAGARRKLGPKLARSFQRLATNANRIRALGPAVVHCVERSQGAQLAGDDAWATRQRQCAAANARTLAREFGRARTLLRTAARQLGRTRFGRAAITPRAIRRAQRRLRRHGLPKATTKLLKRLGLDRAARAGALKLALTPPTARRRTTVAKAAADPSTMKALRSVQKVTDELARQFASG